ncbi:MAG: helix-turn-helix domain-containing protein [Polyangiaceae bacterium]
MHLSPDATLDAGPPLLMTAERSSSSDSVVVEDWLSPFGSLDESLTRGAGRSRVLRLWSDSPGALDALDAHLRRRCERLRLPTLLGSRFSSAGATHDLCERLGLHAGDGQRCPSSSQLLERLLPRLVGFQGACVVYVDDADGDGMLLEAIAQAPLAGLFVALARRALDGFQALPDELSGDDLRRWWEALASHASQRHRGLRWEALVERETQLIPRGSASELLEALRLAARPWPRAAIHALGSQDALVELLEANLVELRDGLIEARAGLPELAPMAPISPTLAGAGPRHSTAQQVSAALQSSGEPQVSAALQVSGEPQVSSALQVARALRDVYPRDPVALERAAELTLLAGAPEEAASSWIDALDACATQRCRQSTWSRVARQLPRLGRELELTLRLSAAELCMDRGDTALALRCSDGAGDSARALLVRGRAALGQGDLAGAGAAFEQAERLAERAGDDHRRAVASNLQAEVELSRGCYRAAADRVAGHLTHEDPRIQFSARNVAGKVLLARSEWSLAEKHFAADAADAALLGEHTEVLKARVNRSVALLALGQLALAESELRRVLKESERLPNPRAAGYALSNLAVLHIDRREYTQALGYLERALDTHLQVGHRTAFAHDVTNLVELRLRMGQRAEAEQTLRFARRALDEPPVTKLCALGLAEARVAFEAGQLLAAKRALANARRHASVAANGDKGEECCRLAVRIALAEGYLDEAAEELNAASERAVSEYARAEIALLGVLLAHSDQRASMASADAAVALARSSGDEELMREAHQAAARVAFAGDRRERALFHTEKALFCRQAVASRLVSPARFLSRSDHLMLEELRALLEAGELSEGLRYPGDEVQLTGTSAATQGLGAALDQARRVPTVVLGERGSGRRYAAHLLHGRLQPRRDLMRVDATGLTVDVLDRRWAEACGASAGSLLIANLDQLDTSCIARLIQRLRGQQPGPWVIATAPVDPDACAPELRAALGEQTLRVPALRQRLSDLDALATGLLRRIARQRREAVAELCDDALCLLRGYDWPGNVEELEMVLRRATLKRPRRVDSASLLAAAPKLERNGRRFAALRATDPTLNGDLDAPRAAFREIVESGFSLPDIKRNVERECIVLALRETSGNITRAAELLGMKRPRLSQLVKQYALVELCSHFAPNAKKAPSKGRNAS